MKITLVTAITAIAALADAFVITDCANGQSTNFGDNKCQIWTHNNFRYESDAGCELMVYSEGACAGKVYSTGSQNICYKSPFAPVSIRCNT